MGYIVALTGGIGSGKSTVADAFSRLGVTIIDADIIARQVVEPGTPALCAIAEHFGHDTIAPDGTLNRRMLRERIFSHPEEKAWLNALLHPLIQQETQRQISQATSPYVLWVVPLLVENKLHEKADRVLVVDVSPATQIQRTMPAITSHANMPNKFLPRRPRVKRALPSRMMLLIITAHRMPLPPMLLACISTTWRRLFYRKKHNAHPRYF